MPLVGGENVGPYEILSLLGSGGMAEVYLARDPRLDRRVALKVLSLDSGASPEHRQRFLREARSSSALNHPNITTIHEIGEVDGRDFIAFEHIAGRTLQAILKESGALTLPRLLELALPIADAIEYAHGRGIVHRDLKPSNVMVSELGIPKVLDFGLAKTLQTVGGQPPSDLTDAGVILGTIAYMSPEQALAREIDQRTDIFSFGTLLYELATARPAFAGSTTTEVLDAVLHRDPVPIARIRPELPEEFGRILKKAHRKDPGQRYQTMADLAADLRHLRANAASVPSAEVRSVVVLPFVNMSADPENQYFCDGLAEELINVLTNVSNLKVVARTTAFSFKDTDKSIEEIGRALNVQAVLEGSVRKARDRLRIAVQLINVRDSYHLWSERFDRKMDDVFAIQDEISLAIVDKLKVELLGSERAKLRTRPTRDHEAYHLYLKGRFYLNKRTEADLARSVKCFEQAIARDSGFAVAMAGLADTYVASGWHAFLPLDVAYTRGKKQALRALETDSTVGEAHASLALIKHLYEWDWAGAEREYRQALALNPADAEARHQYAHLKALLGRFDEALAEMKRALAIEPLSLVINSCVGQKYYFARRFAEAIRQHEKTIEMDPNYYVPHLHLGYDLHQEGRFEDASEEFQRAIDLSGDIPRAMGGLGQTCAVLGEVDRARELIRELEDRWEERQVATYIAQIHVGLKDKDRAFDWLERARKVRHPYLIYLVDPMWDELRSDARFEALLGEINLQALVGRHAGAQGAS